MLNEIQAHFSFNAEILTNLHFVTGPNKPDS